ncbi:hypothetical protein [Streptomyces sp. NPDC002088]|uniref:hypothetical protein n=1 Tax=Streptomyces sp. NPDC002088 TaxID=3154665 RepID=UPI003322CFE9
MRIRRSRLTGDFLQVPNATVRDDRLSHMARGILIELLSRPDSWEATADDMWRASVAKHGSNSPGRRAFRAAFAELKEHGYLTAGKDALPGGRYGTVLTLTDVPHGGTSARPAQTKEPAGQSDVPHAGTSESPADVPPAGTSVPSGQTTIPAGRTDVPLSDVPHAGTSKEENGETKTGKNTSSPADEDLTAFGAFWLTYPKSRDRPATQAAWRNAIANGADPKKIVEAAQAYARERAGEDLRFTKLSANWLRDERYDDDYAQPESNGLPQLRALPSAGHFTTREDAALAKRNAARDVLDQLTEQLRAAGDNT